MIKTFMNSVDPSFLTDEVLQYALKSHTQAEIVKYLIEAIVEAVQ